jgi:GR25 family glycosyltransferase involved in LPS biosynthesis
MKAYVITIQDHDQSMQASRRCIESAKKYGIDVKMFPGYTPESDLEAIVAVKGIPTKNFKEIYSRYERCLAAFLSHHQLWEYCVEANEDFLILEHDAVFVNGIPNIIKHPIVSLGKPSYGKYKTPNTLGEGPLMSKQYFPGAHAYYITPPGALDLVNKAKQYAGPTDIFIHLDNFPYLQEVYPWPVEAKDNFTTIQNRNGCIAKHNYGETYEIL